MGPRLGSRGKAPRDLPTPGAPQTLQWGHDWGVVERASEAKSRAASPLASMGPRLGSRGKSRLARDAGRLRAPLQWGHDWGVVESHPARAGRRRPSSFNGATTGESWKGLKKPFGLLSSSSLQWGHDWGVVERCTDGDLWWRPDTLQWGHDWGVVERRVAGGSGLARRGFNGATTGESWKARPARTARPAYPARLQWGHDWGVVESLRSTTSRAPQRGLQWGHDWGVVERRRPRSGLPPSPVRFNGATTGESWKGSRRTCLCHRHCWASMGPRLGSRGKGVFARRASSGA